MAQSDDGGDVDNRLLNKYRKTVSEQVYTTLARRIHTKVRDARNDPDRAARRWPFELIQNAHDAGVREDQGGISVVFDYADGELRFEHDAAPFTMSDFAALLTGGSSKDFDAKETTGRFGTGFLVTHTLSEHVTVAGVLEADGAFRAFEVSLHRPDDEDAILRSIQESESALGKTQVLPDRFDRPTATLRYSVDNEETALKGLRTLEEALPHLFGSCRHLREVRIRRPDRDMHWTRAVSEESATVEGVRMEYVDVQSADGSRAPTEWRLVRASASEHARSRLILSLCRSADTWKVCKPGNVASVFRQLPVLGGPSLATWVILDGEFDVDEERSRVSVTADDGGALRTAFDALGGLVILATREGWLDGYRIGQLTSPGGSLGETEAKVWQEVLSSAASKLARLPLVNTFRTGMQPGVQSEAHDRWAHFIPRPSEGPSHAELWDLAAECTEVDPPVKSDSEGWSEIAEGWNGLGVDIPWLTLERIGQEASRAVDEIANLAVESEPFDWLGKYLDAVGKFWSATGIKKSFVAHLLPDQHGKLRDADELRRDGGVSERVKDIAAQIDIDIRAQLLDERIVQLLSAQDLESGLYAVEEATKDELTENEAIQNLVRHNSEALPDGEPVGEEDEEVVTASIQLLAYLWDSQGEAARETAWKVPLLAADGTARRAGLRRLMVPPVCAWPETARPFIDAYPPSRVLSDRYCDAEGVGVLLEALAVWEIAHRRLLISTQREELRDRGLRFIAADPEDVADATLRGAELAQIALLEPEIINRCKQSRELAQALLGLVVCHVAPEDVAWASTIEVSVHTPDGEKQVSVTPSLWLSDLRSKPWIPVEDEEKVTHHLPTPELLRELIDPRWLEANIEGAELLVRHFDMDALDVRLLAATGDEAARQKIRDSLARIVEAVGDNGQMIEDLAVKAEQHSRDVNRMRNLGLAVQESVQMALEQRGLEVEVIDRGFDLLVTAEDPEDMSYPFEVGAYKVEVKATTANEVRLTPLQAETAAHDPETFVLCVVNLRDFAEDVHQVDWTATDVSSLCLMVSGRNLPMDDTLAAVSEAEGSDVPIRNTSALRYAVQSDLWETGLGVDAWVEATFAAGRPD